MSSPLKITNLRKSYGSFEAVKGVSFEVKEGEVFGLLGPNGAGKTSIISTITTLEKPSSGKVEVFGFDVTKNPKESKVRVGVVPQEIISHGFFSVEEVLRFHSGYYGIWHNQEQIEYLLAQLSLSEHRHKKVKQLSGGMKRRLLIAKALVHKPKLLLLDEPTAGVDIALRESLWNFVRELKKHGISVLLTTHYLEEAEQLCDRVAIIQKGELRIEGETRKIITQLTKKEVLLTLSHANYPCQSPYLVEDQGVTKKLLVPADFSVGDLLKDIKIPLDEIRDIQIKEGDLEDVMFKVLGEKP